MFKKQMALLLVLALLLGLGAVPVRAAAADHPVPQDWTPEGYVYEVHSDSVCIVGYTGSATRLSIPDTINRLPVTAIGDRAFAGIDLTIVEIPDSVTSIGDYAFYKCRLLSSVVMYSGIEYLGEYVFSKCEMLESISIPDTVTSIGQHAFDGCTKLTSVELPGSLTSIGPSAFASCRALMTAQLPESLVFIGSHAFAYCRRFVPAIPESVQTIDDYAFYYSGVTNAHIPSGVKHIGHCAFEGTGHSSYTVDPANTHYSTDGVALFNKDQTVLYDYPSQAAASYAMPDTVEEIALFAFERCEALTELELSDSLKTIGNSAFSRCTSLTRMEFPATLTTLCAAIFDNCGELELTFLGSAPSVSQGVPFGQYVSDTSDNRITATARYPAADRSWTKEARERLGGNITWVPYGSPFADVKEGSYCYDSVLWALENGITNGISATTFDPNGQCTRAQVVTFLWRANGSPEPSLTGHPFTDVKEGAFYYKAMLWALEQGITKGVTATTFGPNASCNRATVLTFLHRANGSPAPSISKHPFTDVKENAFYYHAVLWAVENSITSGTTATTFSPGSVCTRGQVVTFLYRTYAN